MITPVSPLLFIVLSLLSSAPANTSSTADAWLWQRDHVDVDSIAAFAAFSRGRLHVLAVDDGFFQHDPALVAALAQQHTPTIVTVRLSALGDVRVVVDAVAWWRSRGVDVRAVEIDHDCPSRQLLVYAAWLTTVKAALTASSTALVITALPTWWGHRDHAAVLAAVDELTVQLHAIRAPALFDVDDALRFVRAHPSLRVALPTYAVTLKNGRAIFANAADVARVRAVATDVAWFRLPARDDVTAFTWATLRAVDAGAVVPGALVVKLQQQADGAVSIVVCNDGPVDLALGAVDVSGALVADAVTGFTIRQKDHSWRFSPWQARYVAAGANVVVGWARADSSGTLRADAIAP